MGDLLNAVTFLEVFNAKSANRNNDQLHDLLGRAEYLAGVTGERPVSWYEFQRKIPQDKPSYLRNIGVGAGIGAGVAGGVAALAAAGALAASAIIAPALISGVILGGLLGGYWQTSNTMRTEQIATYEQYLNQFEEAGRGKSIPSPIMFPKQVRRQHGGMPPIEALTDAAMDGPGFTERLEKSKECHSCGR